MRKLLIVIFLVLFAFPAYADPIGQNEVTDGSSTVTTSHYLNGYAPGRWPCGDRIVLPFGNLASVTSVSYKDTAGTETTLAVTTDYLVETNGEQHGAIVLPCGGTWPSASLYPSNPIKIRFVCGWTSAALVPFKIKAAMLLLCADLYENRESQILSGYDYRPTKTVDALLASARLWGKF